MFRKIKNYIFVMFDVAGVNKKLFIIYLFYITNLVIFIKFYVNYCRCSFYLQACEGSTVQILTQGKLSAPRILRIHKVCFSFGFASLEKGKVFDFVRLVLLFRSLYMCILYICAYALYMHIIKCCL